MKVDSYESIIVSRDMGFSHNEFFRAFAPLAREWCCDVHNLGVDMRYDGGRVSIRLGPEGERRIVSIRLPRTCVTFEFINLSEQQRECFFNRFDLSFRRGGG